VETDEIVYTEQKLQYDLKLVGDVVP